MTEIEYLPIPAELRELILASRDGLKYKVLEGPHGIPLGVFDVKTMRAHLFDYVARVNEAQAAASKACISAEAEWKAGTNDRRQAEAAQRKVSNKTYRAKLTGQIQSMWALLELRDGERMTVTIGDTSIEVAREGSDLVCNL